MAEFSQQEGLLKSMLPMAVMLNTLNFKELPWKQLQQIATDASQFIAEHGDNILFKGPKKGDTAKAFNELAKGVAVLSFAPGGVNILGMHFETIHPESIEAGTWLYHSTFADALPKIAKEGLSPGNNPQWEGQFSDWSKGKIFFAGFLPMAAGYADTIFTNNLAENNWSWDPVILRAFSAHLGDVEHDPHSVENWYVERAVPAVFLQVWVPEKQAWVEVREAVAQGYFKDARTEYGKPGKIDVDPSAVPGEYSAKFIEQFWPLR